MVLISTMFEAANIEFLYVIRPKPKPGGDTGDGRLMRHHISATGNESLIFNPRASMKIRSRSPSVRTETTVPMPMVRRFVNVLSSMEDIILDRNMFREDGGDIFVNNDLSVRNAKKMTVYRDTIVLMPSVAVTYGRKERGVSMSVNGEILGTLSYSECVTLADIVRNFDPQTYELIAGLNDNVDDLSKKVDVLLEAVLEIKGMLTPAGQQRDAMTAGFGWQSLNNDGMRGY